MGGLRHLVQTLAALWQNAGLEAGCFEIELVAAHECS